MEYRQLGRTGLKVSALSYGAWASFHNQPDVKAAKELLTVCQEAGVNLYDNAEVYAEGNAERVMGQAIKELGWKRSDLVLSAKIFWGGKGPNDKRLSRKRIIEGTKASLERYQLEYVDLLFCHRPDPDTPIEETVRAMNFALDHGWAFYWGTSEWSAEQIEEAWSVANRLDLVGPHFEQPQYNLFNRVKVEKEFVPLYEKYGLGLTTWSPLASGVLTGKYSGGRVPECSRFGLADYKATGEKALMEMRHQVDKVDQLKPIADELGATLAQLSLAWAVKNPHVSTVSIGATKVEQAKANFKAIELLPKLTPDVMERIEAIMQTKPQ